MACEGWILAKKLKVFKASKGSMTGSWEAKSQGKQNLSVFQNRILKVSKLEILAENFVLIISTNKNGRDPKMKTEILKTKQKAEK